LDDLDVVGVSLVVILIRDHDDLSEKIVSCPLCGFIHNFIVATPFNQLGEGILLYSMPSLIVWASSEQFVILRVHMSDVSHNRQLGSADERNFVRSANLVVTQLKGCLDDLKQVVIRNLGKQVLDGLFGFCIDGDLIFWIVLRTLTILVNFLKKLVIFGIIDDLSSRGKANTIMCTNLGDNTGREMKANTVYFPREFMPGSMRRCLDS
jgi:hypothetical protein